MADTGLDVCGMGIYPEAHLRHMCEYVAILVYEGLIEDVNTFDNKDEAVAWISNQTEECGADRCADSIIWDNQQKTPIDLAFAHRD